MDPHLRGVRSERWSNGCGAVESPRFSSSRIRYGLDILDAKFRALTLRSGVSPRQSSGLCERVSEKRTRTPGDSSCAMTTSFRSRPSIAPIFDGSRLPAVQGNAFRAVHESNKERNCQGNDARSGCWPPVAGVPATAVWSVEPNLAFSQAVGPGRPRHQSASGSIIRKSPAMRQRAAVNRNAARRDKDLVASDRRHNLQQQLRVGRTGSSSEIAALPPKFFRPCASAGSNEHAAFYGVGRQRRQRVDTNWHAGRKIDPQACVMERDGRDGDDCSKCR